ncbi:MAG: PhoH family protein [Desulfobacterales bacterium]
MPLGNNKLFVLDTNVILHDSSCIHHFDEHDIVIPITVLEELDQFKKGKAILNVNARDFVRTLDNLAGDQLFNGGITLGEGRGKISVALETVLHDKLRANFPADKPDHRILNCAFDLAQDHGLRRVFLVTKDVNLRMKAKSIGLAAQDYTSDHVKNIKSLYKGRSIHEDIPSAIIDDLHRSPYEVPHRACVLAPPPQANEYLILRNGSKSALARSNRDSETVEKVEVEACYGIRPRNAEQTFAVNALLNRDIPLVTISGKAGTGKTLLALAAALESKRFYRQIYIARPSVPLSNKDIGYLPGDIQSKLDPYMQPLYDNLAVIQNQFAPENPRSQRIREMLDQGKIVITPLSYIRGRNIVKVFFIVDEAQNLTPHEVKTIITRAGERTKIVFTGDIFQIDHPYLDTHSNGLSYLIEKMQGQKLYAHVNLEKGERSDLSELAIRLL